MIFVKYCESNEKLLESGFIIADRNDSSFSILIEDDELRCIGSFSFVFINDKDYDLDVYKRDVENWVFEYQYINFDENDKKYKNKGMEIIENLREIKNTNFNCHIDLIFRYKITGRINEPKTLYYNLFERSRKNQDEPKGLLRRIFNK